MGIRMRCGKGEARMMIGAIVLGLFGCSAGPVPSAPPVGYDQPAVDQGGPTLPDGPGWIAKVWPRAIELAPNGKFAGRKPVVMFITNLSIQDKIAELNRRFPIDGIPVANPGDNSFPGREVFQAALRSRPKIDCFVFSRVKADTIPADVMCDIFRRVKEGAGCVVIDLFDRSDTLNPEFLMLKWTAQNKELVPGIPYAGLRQVVHGRKEWRDAFNFWNGVGDGTGMASEPVVQPYAYGKVAVAPFGKGKVVWVDTQTHWQRMFWSRTLLPQIQLDRSMWVEADYHYSHVLKTILMAIGHTPAVQLGKIAPSGQVTGGAGAQVEVLNPSAKPFAGKVRWQIRDTWGEVSDRGEMTLELSEPAVTLALSRATFADAGRRFLDLWILDGTGAVVDWGSTFCEVDRGAAAPVIVPQYPNGAPPDAVLAGTVTLAAPPADATLRLALVDRYWRLVGRSEKPAAASIDFTFPGEGLDGQIWCLQADLLDAAGRVLAQSHRVLTRPQVRATRDAFHPLMTTLTDAGPEAAGAREYLRQLGFLASRPYMAGNPIMAEAAAWNDIQMMPFPFRLDCQNINWMEEDRISDFEDPIVRRDFTDGAKFFAKVQRPFGLRGFNLTDDSGPRPELPPAPYTQIAFHEWLVKEYGGLDQTLKAWGWTAACEPAATADDGQLPCDPYVVVQFHEWLKKKYGSLVEVAKAWKIPTGYGYFHVFGSIERESLAKLKAKGNLAPEKDVQAFLAEWRSRRQTARPFGRITHVSVKQANDQGVTAPQIDALRFLQMRWVDYMEMISAAGKSEAPDMVVGTDAAYYDNAQADAFGVADYLAPYYDDRAVKAAVSRGRMRRPGDYGATLGAYGEKPANMCGRRATIWQILFAGGNGYYMWCLSIPIGMNNDFTLSDAHTKYQCEVSEEVMNGIGELFAKAERLFDPIALLDSQTSGLCEKLEHAKNQQPLTGKWNSLGAFQFAFEDLGLNPHTVTQDELAGGWLAKHGIKLLALPAAWSMGKPEAEAIREFVAAGGTVVADVRPATRELNGNRRAHGLLDEVFGVSGELAGDSQRVRGELVGKAGAPDAPELNFGEALADPRVRPTTGTAFGKAAEAPVILFNHSGQGAAFLFNASFSSYSTYRSEGGVIWRPWFEVMKQVAAAAGVRPDFTGTSAGQATPGLEFSPFRNGAGYLLGVEDLGCGDFLGPRRPFEVKLPRALHVYDIRLGSYLGELEVLSGEIPRNGHRAYALLPYPVTGVKLTADPGNPLRRGQTFTLRASIANGGQTHVPHVLRFEARTPDGGKFFPFRRIVHVPAGGATSVTLTLAENDPPGDWELMATDIATGQSSRVSVTVK